MACLATLAILTDAIIIGIPKNIKRRSKSRRTKAKALRRNDNCWQPTTRNRRQRRENAVGGTSSGDGYVTVP